MDDRTLPVVSIGNFSYVPTESMIGGTADLAHLRGSLGTLPSLEYLACHEPDLFIEAPEPFGDGSLFGSYERLPRIAADAAFDLAKQTRRFDDEARERYVQATSMSCASTLLMSAVHALAGAPFPIDGNLRRLWIDTESILAQEEDAQIGEDNVVSFLTVRYALPSEGSPADLICERSYRFRPDRSIPLWKRGDVAVERYPLVPESPMTPVGVWFG